MPALPAPALGAPWLSGTPLSGLPAAPAWRTERGLAVLGPRHFGFDVEYDALAERLPLA